MVIPTKEECIQNDIAAEQIESTIEELINDASVEAYYTICDLLDEEKTVEIATKNQRMYILENLGTILKAELQKGIEHNIFEGRSIEDIIELYKKTVLLLRRIEFDFPSEYQMELYEYTKDERISVLALVGLVQRCNCLINKDKIRNGLVEILQCGASNE